MGTLRSPPSPPPTRDPKFPFYPCLIFSLLLSLSLPKPTTPAPISQDDYRGYYSAHCNGFVPESPVTGAHADFFTTATSRGEGRIVHFDIAYLAGGGGLLPSPSSSFSSSWDGARATGPQFSFRPKRGTFFLTEQDNVLSLRATVRLFLGAGRPRFNTTQTDIRFRPPRIPVRSSSLEFELYGFWSRSDGKLCMVGSGAGPSNSGGVSRYNVALKLKLPVQFSDFKSLISGKLESLDDPRGSDYFEPISILGLPSFGEYRFSLASERNASVCLGGLGGKEENLDDELWHPGRCLAKLSRYARFFELEYGRECSGPGVSGNESKCNPLVVSSGDLPRHMMIHGVWCENSRAIRVLVALLNSPSVPFGLLQKAFDPSTMLIGEAVWDEKKNVLCVVLCRVLNFEDSLANAFVGDCSTRLSLRIPRTYSLRNRSSVEGLISSNKSVDDSGYFHEIRFRGFRQRVTEHGLRYKYTVLDRVNGFCPRQRVAAGRRKAYPDSHSTDMLFDVSVTNHKGQVTYVGRSSPLFLGDQLYELFRTNNVHRQHGPVNISYSISLAHSAKFWLTEKNLSNDWGEISAEGIYDDKTGNLCMLGCRRLTSYVEKSKSNDSMDCEILVSVQFSPLNGNGGITGTIKSLRAKSDPLYFEQLAMSSHSIYASQAAKSIWRMDMEITMVLISNTLACVFVGWQLYHVKKHPDALPSICFVMLIVLTLGYMIPLLLNFEALFVTNHNRQNFLLGSGRWLEINEVTVRVITMIAFLLQFRLLQLAWSARQSDGSHQRSWLAEKRVLCLSLPLYLGGALMAWYLHKWKNSYPSGSYYLRKHFFKHQQTQTWGSLQSYAGLLLDGFLLPQIIFNLFLNTMENALAPAFYVGTTVVRILPHAYDLYRAHTSAWSLHWSYIYANHRQDFFSTTWDIVIPIVGLVFVALIYSQQRFGGRCFLPKRFSETSEYEKVPVVSSNEQRMEVTMS